MIQPLTAAVMVLTTTMRFVAEVEQPPLAHSGALVIQRPIIARTRYHTL